ncbi:MAG: HNH endonuclease [Actinobacteria bacterium]|nr:HNH endonuclease [Actinomycetota bacterium]
MGQSASTTLPPSTQRRSRTAAVTREALARLTTDDQPRAAGYRRDEWPTWKDVDGDGCDARQQALAAASTLLPARSGCKVISGQWTSPYDGKESTDPAAMDVDHVVPLENAYASGGWQWETDQRARFANDQADLWVVSSSSNRSKGSRGPDQWRPPDEASWCEYASRWVEIKVRWKLTATTSERDALGQMLDRCRG